MMSKLYSGLPGFAVMNKLTVRDCSAFSLRLGMVLFVDQAPLDCLTALG